MNGDLLSALPYFRQLSPRTRQQLATGVQTTRHAAGAKVFRQGQMAMGMYWLAGGAARLKEEDSERPIHPKEALGAHSLFQDCSHTGTLTIAETANVCCLPRAHFAAVMQEARVSNTEAYEAWHKWGQSKSEDGQQYFPGQAHEETVLFARRRHPWALCRRFWMVGLVLALGVAGWWALPNGAASGLSLGIGLGLALLIALYQALEWWNDRLIISDQRVINIARTLFGFQTEVSEATLGNIQQISADFPRGDPIARLLNYGTLELRTTGEAGAIVLPYMAGPRALQQELMTIRSQSDSTEPNEDTQSAADNLWEREIRALLGIAELKEEESTLNPEAEGDRVYRKHVFVWVAHIWLGALVFLFGLATIAAAFAWEPLRALGGIGFALAAAITVIGGLWCYLMDWDWRHDLLILGEKTITLHHRRPLWMQSERDEILLERVDSVTSRSVGLLQTLWNYGEVRLALLGDDRADVKRFVGVPQPQRVQQAISRRRDLHIQRQAEAAQAAQREAMAAALHELAGEMTASQPANVTSSPQTEAAPPPAPAITEIFPQPPSQRPPTLPEER